MKKFLLLATFFSMLSGLAFAEESEYYKRIAVKNENGEVKHYFKKVSKFDFEKETSSENAVKGLPINISKLPLYISLKGGLSDMKVGKEKDKTSVYSLGIGTKIHDFRFEIEGIYRNKADLDLGTDLIGDENDDKTDIKSHGFMINAYYDISTGTSLSPFLMFGFGFIKNKVSSFNEYYGSSSGIWISGWNGNSSTEFSYSLGAGFSYQINDNLNFDFSYRYTDLGSTLIKFFDEYIWYRGEENKTYNLKTNEFLAGIRYTF